MRGLGIADASDAEINALASNPDAATTTLAGMVSRRARVGWSTHGHSAVDVNVYSSGGSGTEGIRGNVENTDIGKFLRGYLGVDVDEITRELRENWPLGEPGERHAVETAGEDDVYGLEGLPMDWLLQGE